MPNQPESALQSRGTVIYREYSTDHGEPYYPVPNPENQELYRKYQKLSAEEKNVQFVGRLASYKYFNMDQAILAALELYDDLVKNEILTERKTELWRKIWDRTLVLVKNAWNRGKLNGCETFQDFKKLGC